MIETIIIEDEPRNLHLLQNLIAEYCPTLQVMASATSVTDAIEVIHTYQPQLIFFDIKIIGGTAFDVIEKCNPSAFKIIFTTAFEQYALQAIKLSALDFLLKPISISELIKAVHKATTAIESIHHEQQLEIFKQQYHHPDLYNAKIALPTKSGYDYFFVKDIVYCSADSNYTFINFQDNTRTLVSKTLKEVEDLLNNEKFVRIHQSYIINMHFLSKYIRGNGGSVILHNGVSLDVSVRKKDALLKALKQL